MSLVHLHLALTHVPVVGLFAVVGLLLWAQARHSSEVARAAFAALAVIAAVTGLVFLTGEPAEEAVENLAGVTEDAIHQHEEVAEAALAATVALGVLALAALVRYVRRDVPRWAVATLFVATLGVSTLVAITANLGGQVRHTEVRGASLPTSSDSREERERRDR